ncbi:APC family permease [Actinoplanes flavus]|uniref:Amino acid permease n=1 Tax=Actinoplanes flavus TaxID=2820290 RepID=A0ABS3UVD0_9ACTN|nr:APC family permease [Actinoplanes flavus]MBO3742514.1 amino acid permease [Actinoplanes flavus]
MSQPERKLGTWPIFVIAVSAMTPLTVVAGALPLGYGSVGEKGIPVAYMLVAAVLGIFTVGLAAMARHVPNSGAFYAYASIGLSRPAGVGTAFVALLAYNAMQIGLYGAFGVAAHNAFAIFGLEISWIVWALLGWAVIAALGRLDIDLNARILTVLVCAEVLVVLIFDAAMIGNPAGGTVTFDTLNPVLIASAGGVSLLVAAIAGMVGFEAPLVYAAEARDPRRTVARAIGLTLLVAAVLYGGTAWAMSVAAGPDQIVAVAGAHLNDLFFFLPEPYLPTVLVDLGRIFFATSLFAAMLAFHHTVARYGLTVAREGVLPSGLARTRDGVPVGASLAQSVLALAALLIFAVGVWNPTIDLFLFGTVSGGLGVLILMTIASIAVVRYFRRNPHGETTWRRAVAPWIAAVFLSIVLLLSIAFFSELLDSDNILKIWSPTLLFLAALIGGIVWGRKLRQNHPEVYAVIGTGQPPLPPGETVPAAPTAHELRTGEPAARTPDAPRDGEQAADETPTDGVRAAASTIDETDGGQSLDDGPARQGESVDEREVGGDSADDPSGATTSTDQPDAGEPRVEPAAGSEARAESAEVEELRVEPAASSEPVAENGATPAVAPRPAPRKRTPQKRSVAGSSGSAADTTAAKPPPRRSSPRPTTSTSGGGTGAAEPSSAAEPPSGNGAADPESAVRAPRAVRTPPATGGSASRSRGTQRQAPRPRGSQMPDESPAVEDADDDR